MNKEVAEVCAYLRTKFITIPPNNDWLVSCVECFKEHGTYSLNEIKNLVYQQWLLADLTDIGVQVLPNRCFSEEKCILEGKYAVQLNYFVNVAVSFHKQLQKIRRPDVLKNLDVDSETPSGFQNKESTSNRILKIELTDGAVTIIGFEDQFISALQEPYVPGKKAILVGPIECRKQILFLKAKNIILLGGEVDALLIPNATENILARKLKLPENPDPYSDHIFKADGNENGPTTRIEDEVIDDDEEAMMMLAEVIEKKVPDGNFSKSNSRVNSLTYSQPNISQISSTSISSNSHSSSTYPKKNISSIEKDSNRPESNMLTSNLQSVRNTPQVFSVSDYATDLEFDDDFELLAVQTAASTEKNFSEKPISMDEIASKFRAYEMFDSTAVKKDLKEITELKQKLNESYNIKAAQSSTTNESNRSSSSRDDGKIIVDYLSDKESPLTNLPVEPELSEGTPSSMEGEPSDSDRNYFSLEPFPPRKRPAIVTAFARVVKVLKKPKLKGDKWSVSALVEAKGMEIEVTFDSEVIDKVFAVSAKEIISKRGELTSDPVMKQKMNEILKQSQLKFSKLACVMTFNFKDAISDPVVIDVKFSNQ